jgi:O-antigen ligase/cytochrome c-type biogenesis protein CcmH/NrfG
MKDFLKAIVYAGLFAIPFLTLYVENDFFFPFITGKNFWFRIIIDGTLIAWLLLALYEVRYRPKFSWIMASFAALLGVMFIANAQGVHPNSSFWSNFERMDGYVSLVHTFLYMVMLGSVLTTKKLWFWFLNVSVAVAAYVAGYGLMQYLGYADGSNRIDSTLGNAAYMAIYTLFHIFIILWLFVQSKEFWHKAIYLLLLPMFAFVLIETGTRGTAVGLAVGVMVMSAYIGLFGNQFKQYRKYAVGGFVFLLLAVGGFVAGRDSELVQSQPNLARIANISLDDLQIRGIIWGMAWEGVKERPVFGYGQSNFNYVFNANYDPRLYAQEQWFDRSHNIFMDWLIAGGFVGLLTYLSLFGACLYYLLVRPFFKKDESFTVIERGILLGLLAGYFTHNLVVFDNIVSYIFFAVILGFIHSRVATPIKSIADKKVDDALITQAALPAGIVAFGLVVYFVYAPGMAAAGDIIQAFRSLQPSVVQGVQQAPAGPTAMLEELKEAVDRDSFAHQEIAEQIAQQAMSIARAPQVDDETKQAFTDYAEEQLDRLVAEKPGDARVHVFIASYYRATNQLEKAVVEMAIARELSPNKQAIIIQQGFIELSRNGLVEADSFFETAFKLDERNPEAREYYAASRLYQADVEGAAALIDTEKTKIRFANSDFLLAAANQAGATELMIDLFKTRLDSDDTDAQNWATLAYLYYEQDDNGNALRVLEEAQTTIPSFASTASCIAGNITAGNEPQTGC